MSYKKFIKYDLIRQLSLIRKYRKSKEKKRQRNRRKLFQKKSYENSPSPSTYQQILESTIHAGTTFSMFEDAESVIKLVNEIDSYKNNTHRLRRILIDLSDIKSIDIGAITFLLAKVHEMNRIKRIQIWGNTPKDLRCKEILLDSGFLD